MLCAIVLSALTASSSGDGGAGPEASGTVAPQVRVTIHGALALPPEVYLEVLRLGPGARADAATANDVRAQLQGFLHRLGYELATVTTRLTPDGIEAELDEGKIERILFLGRLSFQQLRFKLAMVLPHEVFNRRLLDSQVRELSEKLNVTGVQWELVRTEAVAHRGPQISSLPSEVDFSLVGIKLVHPRRPYEVRVRFPELTGSTVGVDLRANYIDGLEAGLNYAWRGVLLPRDVWYTAISGGFGLRYRIDDQQLYPYFSRGMLTTRYDTPPIFEYFTPNLWTQASVVSRQRPDLNLESYSAFTADAALQLELKLRPGLRVVVGGGYQYRLISGLEVPAGLDPPLEARAGLRSRPFFRVAHESVLNPELLRWDRRHTLESELRYFFPVDQQRQGFGWLDLRYQYVKELGWNDFWVKSRGHLSWGELSFHDEISLGELVRGVFVGQWLPTGMAVLLEYRLSLLRDDIKVGLFNDLALFAAPVRGDPSGKLRAELATGFGPSLHLLVVDMFQVDMYLGFGFRRNAQSNASFSLNLEKAF